MTYFNISDLIDTYQKKDPLIDTVYEIVNYIKKHDYEKAKELLMQNNISFYDLVNRTQRLKVDELVKFADYVISHK